MRKYGNLFEIKRIYFYNGGYLDMSTDSNELDKTGKLFCNYYDKNDNEWCFRFHGEMVQSVKDK